ncbi:MAG: helix-turn-helix domain-containing protein [Chitinivibrionales bacterium]|nr:helix-turn-helix domain-containing protein [Chitinivibrionales bacterium]
MTHEELRKKALKKKGMQAAFDELETEFSLLRRMLFARKRAGLSQAEVANRMGTKAPAIARLERSLGSGIHSPSVQTLRKYAKAVNCRLDIKLVAAK